MAWMAIAMDVIRKKKLILGLSLMVTLGIIVYIEKVSNVVIITPTYRLLCLDANGSNMTNSSLYTGHIVSTSPMSPVNSSVIEKVDVPFFHCIILLAN